MNNDMMICDVHATEVLDSRGNPTVKVKVVLEDGSIGESIVPSGASTGVFEAVELRDEDKTRYSGKGVLKACENVNKIIAPHIIGMKAHNQNYIDNELISLDGTKNKENLGANAILGVSLAVCRSAANSLKIPLYKYIGGVNGKKLPVPMMNILNGGKHANNNLDIQEFMIVPHNASSFSEALQMGTEIFHTLGSVLKENNLNTGYGDEGGYAPDLENDEEALFFILQAIEKCGYTPYEDVSIALDVASSEIYDKESDSYAFEDSMKASEEMISYYEKITKEYPIISIEDGLNEDDFKMTKVLTEKIGDRVQIVGDDLFVTNVKRLKRGIKDNVANSILIKLNQIGTLTETIDAIELAKTNNYTAVVSHRSGESEDSFIADLVVALNTGQIKTGAPNRTDRVCKYNRLLEIEKELINSRFEGKNSFYNLKSE